MAKAAPFRLASCPKRYTLDQDKTVDPLSTVKTALERLGQRYDLSHLRIEPRQDAVEGAYSFSSLSDQLNASGKGLTPEQSQASAIMEFAERYSWLHFDYEDHDGYMVKSFREMKTGLTPTVDDSYWLCNFIGLRDRDELLKEIKRIPLKWIRGISLTSSRKFYYPVNWHNYIFTSNGLATGNAREEAILQAACEVIERENVYRLFGDKKIANDLDPASIKNPIINRVLENAKKSGIKIIIKEISLDFGIPTFAVHGIQPADKGRLTHKGCGYGTHPNPEKALIRALSEYFEGYSLLKKTEKEVELDWAGLLSKIPPKNYGFLAMYNPQMLLKRKRVVKMKDLPDLSRDDIKEEIEEIVKILSRHKYEVIFMDKTHPELKIPVVRVFIPGMRNLMVNEFQDPTLILSEAYYETGNAEASEKYLNSFYKKFSFHLPEVKTIKPDQVFKKDYKETLLAAGGFKQDAVEILKLYADVLKKYRPYG